MRRPRVARRDEPLPQRARAPCGDHGLEALAHRGVPGGREDLRHGARGARLKLVVADAVEVAAVAALAPGLRGHLDDHGHEVHARQRDLGGSGELDVGVGKLEGSTLLICL